MTDEVLQERTKENIIKSEQEILDIFFKDSIGQYLIAKNNEISGNVNNETIIKNAVENINNFLNRIKLDSKIDYAKVEKITNILDKNIFGYVTE